MRNRTDGEIFVRNEYSRESRKTGFSAAVGLSEAEARKQSPNVRMISATVPEWYTARRMAKPVYGYKTLVEAESGRILGAHLVGPHGDEVINLFGLAIRHNLTADDLKTTIFAYPTAASDIGSML